MDRSNAWLASTRPLEFLRFLSLESEGFGRQTLITLLPQTGTRIFKSRPLLSRREFRRYKISKIVLFLCYPINILVSITSSRLDIT